MISDVFNMDCMIGMAKYPDKFFELAIVDPPYGLGDKLKPRGGMISNSFTKMDHNDFDKLKQWDKPPSDEYFKELFRISQNQVIWGGNYFWNVLYPAQCFIVWDKMNGTNPMADCEFAWTSFRNQVARIFRMHHFSAGYDDKIHPTQKPIKLYKWLLKNYAQPHDKILDTHLGSGSSRIAAYSMGFDFYGFEIDKEYYDASERRFNDFKMQLTIF